jgi:hypothetical protein
VERNGQRDDWSVVEDVARRSEIVLVPLSPDGDLGVRIMNATTKVSSSLLAIVCCAPLVLSSPGCAQSAVNKRVKQYQERFDGDVGKTTKDDYIKVWGPPLRSARISDGEVCTWRFSYGTRGYASGSGYGVHARAHEMYDEFIMTFDENGVLKQHRFWVQR